MNNYFQRSPDSPYHISVGAVLVNQENKIACHYFDQITLPDQGTFKDVRILMRETIEPNETIEQCLARGLMEEFGAVGTLRAFLGSIVSHPFLSKEIQKFEKTTLYFLCDLVSIDQSKRNGGDIEAASEIEWRDADFLIETMKDQAVRFKGDDTDESVVVERAKGILVK